MDTWREGFLLQAKQDFAVVQAVVEWRNTKLKSEAKNKKQSPHVNDNSFGASLCMLLQMFFEKYSKAFFVVGTMINIPQKITKPWKI